MEMKRKTAKEHNKLLNNVKRKPVNMTAQEWNSHLDSLKRDGKYNGEIYAHTRNRVDELFEIEEDIAEYNRGE